LGHETVTISGDCRAHRAALFARRFTTAESALGVPAPDRVPVPMTTEQEQPTPGDDHDQDAEPTTPDGEEPAFQGIDTDDPTPASHPDPAPGRDESGDGG
jgi:hypothetical protein